jgi:bla regulator protein BlaR1
MSVVVLLLLKVTVTTALALIAVRLARRSRAAVRHVLLAASFGVLVLLPIASIVAPSVRVSVPTAVQEAIAPLDFAPGGGGVPFSQPVDAPPVVTPMMPKASWPSLSAVLLAVWIAGTTVCLLPVAAGLWQVRLLRRSSQLWRDGRVAIDALADHVNLHRRIDVLLHEALPGPMTAGIVRPAIVLPIDAETWPDGDLSRAIVHELEHVRRGDWVSLCLARVVAACYWFHPIVWAAHRQLALEAERACDDAVLAWASLKAGVDSSTAYADQLVLLARRLSTSANHPPLAMANRRDLATRVVAVLDSRQRRGRAGKRWVAVACAASVVLIATISPLRIVAEARARPRKPQSTVAAPRFEVASIKPCKADDLPPGGRGGGSARGSASPGRLHLDCVPLVGANGLIRQAYGTFVSGIRNAYLQRSAVPVEGGPAWVQTDRYTIDAKAAGTPTLEMMRGPMLQALLEDRFRLKIRRETRGIPVYDLTVAKGGPKLKPFDGRCKPVDFSKGDIPAQLEAEGSCPIAMRNTRVDAPGQTIGDFITFVLSLLDRPVIDKTGLSGRFDISLEFTPDDSAGPADVTSILAVAVQQQLGLKLVPATGPGEFLVIEHIDRPSPNGPVAIFTAPARPPDTAAARAGK